MSVIWKCGIGHLEIQVHVWSLPLHMICAQTKKQWKAPGIVLFSKAICNLGLNKQKINVVIVSLYYLMLLRCAGCAIFKKFVIKANSLDIKYAHDYCWELVLPTNK